MRKAIIIKALVAATVFSVVLATAASLGTVDGGQVGAGSGNVTACDSDGVNVAHNSVWDVTDERYEVTQVTVTNIASTACNGKTISVTLVDSTDAMIGEGTTTVPASPATSATITLSTAASAQATVKVHVTIL